MINTGSLWEVPISGILTYLEREMQKLGFFKIKKYHIPDNIHCNISGQVNKG
jgi:hypothetical protein